MRCLNPECHLDGLSINTEVCPNCGLYIPSILRDLLPMGKILKGGSYRLDYPLGRGGFGVTYKAIHIEFEQPVAIKEFYPQQHAFRHGHTGGLTVPTTESSSYERSLERFKREGRILYNLNHPNIVRVQDLFSEQNTAYLVMELLTGNTLKQELKAQGEKRLLLEQIAWIIESLVKALTVVHQAGIYHLDLKPDNVILTNDGRVVLVDFGAARQGFRKDGTQGYTPEYAAPEVVAGQNVGPESDIFELGMMLYEMLIGERATPALNRLIKDNWKPKALAEPWQSLINSALRISKEERPKTVEEWWNQYNIFRKIPKIEEEVYIPALDVEHNITLSIREAFEGVQKRLTLTDETVEVRIPPGAKIGSRLRVKSKGLLDAKTSIKGDLYLIVDIAPDDFFQFEGENLICEIQITPDQATSGIKIDIPTLESSVSMRIPAGISSGQILRLKGKGWLVSDGRRGDQLVRVNILVSEDVVKETPTLTPIIVSQWGDGDYRTISAAIENARSGSRIVVRPGVYTEGLLINKPLAIAGDGSATDIIIESTKADCILMATDSALVRGLTLRGRSGSEGNKFYAVDIPQGKLVLEDCYITNDSLPSVAIHGATANPTIRRCEIANGQSMGIMFYDNGQGTIQDCNIFGNMKGEIAIADGANPVIRRCKIHDGLEEGIWVGENGRGMIEDCDIFANNQAGITIIKNANPTIRRCKIHDGLEAGILVSDHGQGIIEECDIFANSKAGIEIKDQGSPLVRDCRIHDEIIVGIVVHNYGQGKVIGSEIFGNKKAGILIFEEGNPQIQQCHIRNNQGEGILFLREGKGTIDNCYIISNQEHGISIGSQSNPTIINCQIYDNQASGVYVSENAQGVIETCDIFNNASAGVSIVKQSHPTIRRCRIRQGQQEGVFIYNNGRGLIEECDIFGNTKTGIEIKEYSNPIVQKCQIHDNQASGIMVCENGQGLFVNCNIYSNNFSGIIIQEEGNPVVRQCKINRNNYEAVWVRKNGKGTIENCDLTNNVGGAWDIDTGCTIKRIGNKE
jgi:F-box protein 11